eukprot:13802554-Ditylum_brightwellii.AAC.1
MKQDEIENAVGIFTSFFSEEQCWEDAYSDKGGMGLPLHGSRHVVVDLPYSDPYSLPTGDEYDMSFTYTSDAALDIEKKDTIA